MQNFLDYQVQILQKYTENFLKNFFDWIILYSKIKSSLPAGAPQLCDLLKIYICYANGWFWHL